ncbi:MAG: spore germination protein, partial [Clostridiales bacterium]|nr:spore germination protein [Clostridiales bacterium]
MYEITLLEKTMDEAIDKNNAYEFVKESAVTIGEIKEAATLDRSMLLVMSGEVALIVEGSNKILVLNARG